MSGLRAWWTRTFDALHFPTYRRYWFSQMLSLLGTWLQTTAQQYLVLELSGNSSTALGLVTVCQFLPSLLFSLLAGAVVDRVSRRRVLLTTQFTMMCTALALAISTHLGQITVAQVMLLALISGTATAFDMPARQSLAMDLVPREAVPNALALNSLNFNLSRTLGQALFGLIVALGVRWLAKGQEHAVSRLALPFYLNAASFLLVMYTIATLPLPKPGGRARSSMIEDIQEGLRYVQATPTVRRLILLSGILSLSLLNFNVIIPYYVRVIFGAKEATFGLLSAALGSGAAIGALWQASRPNPLKNLRRGLGLVISAASLLAITTQPLLAVPVLVVCGFGMLSFLISANSAIQLSIPDHLRGRVMSLYSFALLGMAPLGALIASIAISREGPFGPRWGLLLLVGIALSAVLWLWNKLPKQLDERA